MVKGLRLLALDGRRSNHWENFIDVWIWIRLNSFDVIHRVCGSQLAGVNFRALKTRYSLAQAQGQISEATAN